MCDLKKYAEIYYEIKKLTSEDTLQLVSEAETEELRRFYELVADYLLQIRQKEAMERNAF